VRVGGGIDRTRLPPHPPGKVGAPIFWAAIITVTTAKVAYGTSLVTATSLAGFLGFFSRDCGNSSPECLRHITPLTCALSHLDLTPASPARPWQSRFDNRDAATTAAPSALLAAGTPLEPGKHRPTRTAGEYSNAIGRPGLGIHPDGHWLAPRPRSARLMPVHAKGDRVRLLSGSAWDHFGTTRHAPRQTTRMSPHPVQHPLEALTRQNSLDPLPGGQGVAGSNPAVSTQRKPAGRGKIPGQRQLSPMTS
jgi:hypothetical protein